MLFQWPAPRSKLPRRKLWGHWHAAPSTIVSPGTPHWINIESWSAENLLSHARANVKKILRRMVKRKKPWKYSVFSGPKGGWRAHHFPCGCAPDQLYRIGQTCAKIQRRSGTQDPQNPGSGIVTDPELAYCRRFSGSWILSAQFLRDPVDLGPCLEKLLLDPGDPESEKMYWLRWVFDH